MCSMLYVDNMLAWDIRYKFIIYSIISCIILLFAVHYVINLQKAAPVKLSYFSNASRKKLSGYDTGEYELINL
jgi:hypothetical protein